MQATSDFLGTEPVGRLTLRLAIPAVTAQLVNMLYNLVDRMYIGHIADIGSLALTGVGVCAPLILLISAFAALVFMGGAPRVSMLMGKGENEQAERVMGNCFTLLVGLSILLTVVISIWDRDLLLLFGASKNTVGYAEEYMRIYTLGTLFVQLTLGMNAFITAQGFAKVSMLTVLIGALCNIVLDPLFIFVFDLGVQGAAIATVLSQAVSAVWVMLFITGKKCVLRLKLRNLRVQPRLVAPCILLGLSPFVMQSTESVLSVCFNASLLKYGGDIAVGAMTILSSVMQFALLPLQGIAQGSQPITSYNYGAGNADRVRATFRLLVRVCLLYSAALWALIMLAPAPFARMFSPDAALVAFTARALRIYCGALFLFGIQIACQITFVSIGNAPCSIFVAVLRKFILLLPLIYLMPHLFPADPTTAVYMAEPVADAVAVTCTALLFAWQFRRAMRRLEKC